MEPPYPAALAPVACAPLRLSSGMALSVPVARPRFTPWNRAADVHTFGGKQLLRVDNEPQFAEVAILRLFEAEGWQGRWVETYGRPAMGPGLWRHWHPDGPRAQEHHAFNEPWVERRLQGIARANGGTYSGCWDVVAWKEERLVFAESKKAKHDRLRPTQLRWAEAALACGAAADDLLLVEWAALPER